MTPQEFAARLNGRQYRHEITKAEQDEAKTHGLVVMFGYSDDNVELVGAIDEEIPAYEGTTLCIGKDRKVQPPWDVQLERDDSEEACEAWFARKAAGVRFIEANWGANGYAWTFTTLIPHATFEVLDGGEKFCRGIVFNVADI